MSSLGYFFHLRKNIYYEYELMLGHACEVNILKKPVKKGENNEKKTYVSFIGGSYIDYGRMRFRELGRLRRGFL